MSCHRCKRGSQSFGCSKMLIAICAFYNKNGRTLIIFRHQANMKQPNLYLSSSSYRQATKILPVWLHTQAERTIRTRPT